MKKLYERIIHKTFSLYIKTFIFKPWRLEIAVDNLSAWIIFYVLLDINNIICSIF